MSLKSILEIRHTLAFRLTLWYATIFTLSSLGAFFIFYMIIANVIQERMDQQLLNDIAEFSSIFKAKGDDSFKAEMEIEAQSDGVGKIFLRLLDSTGQEIAASDMSSWKDVGIGRSALKHVMEGENHMFETLSVPERPYKVRIVYAAIAPGRILQIGLSLEEDARFLEAFREVFVPMMIMIMVFSALIGWFMAKGALSGVGAVTETAVDISKGAFEKRVQIKAKGNEIEQLAMAFNRMLDRIHDLVTGMKEVTDNIAHDVKTPIARIRGLAETELTAGKSGDECQKLAADTIEECDNLLQMINTMLAISEAEAKIAEVAKAPVDMAAVIKKALELFGPVAEEKGVRLVSEVPEHTYIPGDIHGLQRMIVNLLENAVKYTPCGGKVTVSIDDDNKHTVIEFHDTGIGISEKDRPHIFKRLYRCDRSRSQPGFGLGLSLALAVARAHGGNITVTSQPDKGSSFKVTLPQ